VLVIGRDIDEGWRPSWSSVEGVALDEVFLTFVKKKSTYAPALAHGDRAEYEAAPKENALSALARARAPFVISLSALALLACAVGTTDSTGGDITSQAPTDPTPPAHAGLPAAATPSGSTADAGHSGATASGSGGTQPPGSSGSSGSPGKGSSSSSSSSGGAACTGHASPTASSVCNGCGTKHTCQPNGCYNGYWCDLTTTKCVAKPAGC
jgi:hypothetical protein